MTTQQTADLFGVTLRQLQHWDEVGLVSPKHVKTKRYKAARDYSPADLMKVGVVAELRKKHLRMTKVRAALTRLSKSGESAYLLTDGQRHCVAAGSWDAVKHGVGFSGMFLIVDLDGIRRKIEKAVANG